MIYEDVGSSGYYSNVAFNATIEVVEKPKLVDMEGIFMYLMIAAALGGTGGVAAPGGWAAGNETCTLLVPCMDGGPQT